MWGHMPTAKAGYRVKDGTRVPSVTTIIGKFKEAGGLMHWAWQLGIAGKDYREVRDEAADAGTLAHALVEQWIRKQPLAVNGPDEVVQKACNAFNIFMQWANQSRLEVTETEVALVSEKHRFGGTLDAMLVNGKVRDHRPGSAGPGCRTGHRRLWHAIARGDETGRLLRAGVARAFRSCCVDR